LNDAGVEGMVVELVQQTALYVQPPKVLCLGSFGEQQATSDEHEEDCQQARGWVDQMDHTIHATKVPKYSFSANIFHRLV
jgi:hypothetical protein